MGMAASQARYLGLTARKTNVEYEGQQINQQRTALANQSASFYNQLYSLQVPSPPSTADYTQTTYSYNDGTNTNIIDKYTPLTTTDPDYNYSVTHYYNGSVYTGVETKLNNPGVHGSYDANHTTFTPTQIGNSTLSKYSASTTGATGASSHSTSTTTGSPAVTTYKTLVDGTNTYALTACTSADSSALDQITTEHTSSGITDYTNAYKYTDSNGKTQFVDTDSLAAIDTGNGGTAASIDNFEAGNTTQFSSIKQIITDLPSSNFAADYANSVGNIYTYTDSGSTKFACQTDLKASYDSTSATSTPLLNQTDLNTYNATSLSKKIYKTENASIVLDGDTGRFKSIKLASSSANYDLTTNTTTDENSYNDAMNQYEYDTANYQKQVEDINAKTSVIQVQDRTLELRLRQLDTEQEALQTEMESVKKVIDKNIESTFKTFQ